MDGQKRDRRMDWCIDWRNSKLPW